MDAASASAHPSGVKATRLELATLATEPSHISALPDSLLEQVLSRVSARTGGYSHALVCRLWAALAPSAQTRVRPLPPWNPCGARQPWNESRGRVEPDKGTVARSQDSKLHVSTRELIQALQSLPHVTALDLPGRSMYDVTPELFLRLLRACPRLRALRAPGLSLRSAPQDPGKEWIFWKLPETNRSTLSPAVLWEHAPGLRHLDMRRCKFDLPYSIVELLPAVDLGILVSGTGDHVAREHRTGDHGMTDHGAREQRTGHHGTGAETPFAKQQQLRKLGATVEVPFPAGLMRLRSMPRLKALSLKLMSEEASEEGPPREEAAEEGALREEAAEAGHGNRFRDEDALTFPYREGHANTLFISSPSLEELSLETPEDNSVLRLNLGPLPALRALSLTLGRFRQVVSGLSRLTALTSLAVSGLQPGGEDGVDGGPNFPCLRALSSLRSLTWYSWDTPLPTSVLGLTGLTSLDVFAQSWAWGPWKLGGWQRLRSLQTLSVTVRSFRPMPTQLIGALAELQSLKDLTISCDGDEWVNLKALSSLQMLTSLVASGPGATDLPLEHLTGLKHLVIHEALSFRDRRKETSMLHSVSWMQRLQRLQLSSCGGDLIGLQPLSTLQALQELAVFECSGFKEVHASLGALSQLQKLQLKDYSVGTIHPRFFSAPNFASLMHLRLCLPLRAWPASLQELPFLRLLAGNLMSCITKTVHRLKDLLMPPSLEVLELQDCPWSMGQDSGEDFPSPMPRLRRLVVSDTRSITSLPQNLGSLRSLCQLWLLDLPELQCFPGSFSELGHLQGLVVQGCSSLKRIPHGCASLPCFLDDPELLGWFEPCDPRTC